MFVSKSYVVHTQCKVLICFYGGKKPSVCVWIHRQLCCASAVLFHWWWCTCLCWKLIFLCRARLALSPAIQWLFFLFFFLIQIWMHLSSCCHKCVCSSRGRHRGHFVLQQNGHGPFCVRTNQWKDEPASSEDVHEMP